MTSIPNSNYGNKILYVGGLQADTVSSNSLAINTNTPVSGSIFTISSTDNAMLPPRMTTAQKNAINGGTPPVGAVVYDIDLGAISVRGPSAWEVMSIPSQKSFARLKLTSNLSVSGNTFITTEFSQADSRIQNIGVQFAGDANPGFISLVPGKVYTITTSLFLRSLTAAEFEFIRFRVYRSVPIEGSSATAAENIIDQIAFMYLGCAVEPEASTNFSPSGTTFVDTTENSAFEVIRFLFTFSDDTYSVDSELSNIIIAEI